MIELELKGCRSQPLISYLKSLGVLRLVSEQVKDHQAAAAWRNESFVLRSRLNAKELVSFFSDDYVPTPIMGPWAGGSGFFGNDNRDAVDVIGASTVERLKGYRVLLDRVQSILAERGIEIRPEGEIKAELLRVYRRELSDEFVRWMDCAIVLQTDGQSYPPLLGTGGNDGRLDFTRNFMDRLVDLGIHLDPAALPADLKIRSKRFLANSLFGQPCPNLFDSAVGQFHPGGVGGPNGSQGMQGPSLVNPWDFILMLEGALVMAGALSRRMGEGSRGKAVFPFTVSAAQVGDGGLVRADVGKAQGEIWMPLWNHFARLAEISLVFSEGRAELSGRQCRNGVELAQAASGLGVDRGLNGFVRYGFLKRSGKAFLATPLGRFDVTLRPQVDLLRELDTRGWLDSFRRACSDKNAPPRFASALRRLDSAIVGYCRYGTDTSFRAVFRALGQIERELALLAGRPIVRWDVRPIPSLSTAWTSACDDSTLEFRIAAALASIQQKGEVGALSAHLEPVDRNQRVEKWGRKTGQEVWGSGSLARNLLAVLERRLMDAGRHSVETLPLDAHCEVGLEDIVSFLEERTDDKKIEEYLWSTILVRRPTTSAPEATPIAGPRPVSRAYCILKLLFLPSTAALKSEADGKPVRAEPTILTHLRAGNIAHALNVAARRLRMSGYIPMPGPLSGGKARPMEVAETVSPLRLGAALLIPLRAQDTFELKKTVLRERSD